MDDRRLHRLVSYIHHTHDETLQSFVGDHADDLSVMLWVDDSLADDLRDSKSTSGAYLAIVGPNSFAPIMSFAKQHEVSHSSIESEIVALEGRFALRDFIFSLFGKLLLPFCPAGQLLLLLLVLPRTSCLNNDSTSLCRQRFL